MMNLIGKWNVYETMRFDEEKGMCWENVSVTLTRDDLDKDDLMLLKAVAVFDEDGSLSILSPLPEGVSQEMVDEAVASGVITLKDGMMLTDQKHWKVENGKNLADTGAEGEVLGEKVGPWEEIKEIGEDTIEIMMMRLKRAE